MIIALSFALAGCGWDHGGRRDPIASADTPFSSALADELSSQSRNFARQHGLAFETTGKGGTRVLTLRDGDIHIEATLSDARLNIVATGPVTENSTKLANQYINKATNIR